MSEVKSVFVAGLLLALGGLGLFFLKSDNDYEPKNTRKQKQQGGQYENTDEDDNSIETYDSNNFNDDYDLDEDEYDDGEYCEDDMCYPEENVKSKKTTKPKTIKNKKAPQKKSSKRRY